MPQRALAYTNDVDTKMAGGGGDSDDPGLCVNRLGVRSWGDSGRRTEEAESPVNCGKTCELEWDGAWRQRLARPKAPTTSIDWGRCDDGDDNSGSITPCW